MQVIACIFLVVCKSPSSRRAWIEMASTWCWLRCSRVALLTEGVDRNHSLQRARCVAQVALLTEGVDRNDDALKRYAENTGSPSSRRAWIEIRHPPCADIRSEVALLAEGVDRNPTLPAF